jgi:hypothetical protein
MVVSMTLKSELLAFDAIKLTEVAESEIDKIFAPSSPQRELVGGVIGNEYSNFQAMVVQAIHHIVEVLPPGTTERDVNALATGFVVGVNVIIEAAEIQSFEALIDPES